MEIRHIKELMTAMGRTGIKRLTLKKDDVELVLEREDNHSRSLDPSVELADDIQSPSDSMQRANVALSKAKESASSLSGANRQSVSDKEDVTSVYITSPMVGTFYGSSSPDAPPYIKEGDKVDKNSVACIIEAMKVMNEVKAGVSGIVAEVLVESGSPVEFGTKLFRII